MSNERCWRLSGRPEPKIGDKKRCLKFFRHRFFLIALFVLESERFTGVLFAKLVGRVRISSDWSSNYFTNGGSPRTDRTASTAFSTSAVLPQIINATPPSAPATPPNAEG